MGIFSLLILIGIAVYTYQKFFASNRYETRDERYNAERHKRQVELDGLLDKIATRGMESLSDAERRRLDELSGKR